MGMGMLPGVLGIHASIYLKSLWYALLLHGCWFCAGAMYSPVLSMLVALYGGFESGQYGKGGCLLPASILLCMPGCCCCRRACMVTC